MMHAQLAEGALLLRFGRQFGIPEAERLAETVLSFAPLSQLTLDFTEVRDFQDSACGLLARLLAANRGLKLVLHGLTLHQSRMLGYRGVREPGCAVAAEADHHAP
jgi:hypothetical protein